MQIAIRLDPSRRAGRALAFGLALSLGTLAAAHAGPAGPLSERTLRQDTKQLQHQLARLGNKIFSVDASAAEIVLASPNALCKPPVVVNLQGVEADPEALQHGFDALMLLNQKAKPVKIKRPGDKQHCLVRRK